MKKQQFDSLGVKANILVYESVEEGDKAAGKEGAVLAECNKNLAYRGALAAFRDQFVDFVEKHTGIAREMKESGKKNDKGEPIMTTSETEAEYIRRVCAEKGWTSPDLVKNNLQQIADQVGEFKLDEKGEPTNERLGDLRVDITEPERRATGPKKLPKIYLEAAQQIFKNGNQETWRTRLATENNLTVTYGEDEAKNHEALGWAIKAREDAIRKSAVSEYK